MTDHCLCIPATSVHITRAHGSPSYIVYQLFLYIAHLCMVHYRIVDELLLYIATRHQIVDPIFAVHSARYCTVDPLFSVHVHHAPTHDSSSNCWLFLSDKVDPKKKKVVRHVISQGVCWQRDTVCVEKLIWFPWNFAFKQLKGFFNLSPDLLIRARYKYNNMVSVIN